MGEEAAVFIDEVAIGMAKLYNINETAKQLRIKQNDTAMKNEMDSGCGRVYSQENFDGRLFVHMIGLII